MLTCVFRRRASRLFLVNACLSALCSLLSALCSRADVVLLKDGFALHGKVKREVQTFVDPASGLPIEVAKLNGFFMLDNEVRRVIFSSRQVEDVTDTNPTREADPLRFRRTFTQVDHWRVPPLERLLSITPWDANWQRTFKAEGPLGRVTIDQRLTDLTPFYARVDALRYNWISYFLTREFDPEMLRTLLSQHPELKPAGNKEDAAKRLRVYRFFVQAGWYDEAEKELQRILQDFPEQKEQVENSRTHLTKLKTLQLLDEIEHAHKAGRPRWVHNHLAALERTGGTPQPEGVPDEKLVTRVRTLKALCDKTAEDLALAQRFLKELPRRLGQADQRSWLAEAAATILAELHPDTLPRLDAFLRLAQQQGDRPSPEQLLALAVSGWLLGNNSAEAKVETARRLWQTRQFVLEYQRTRDEGARERLRYAYQQRGEALAFDELAQLIRFLPPPEPFNLWSILPGLWPVPAPHWPLATLYWPVLTGHWPIRPNHLEFQAQVPLSIRKGPNYLVQLPLEYHPGRSYPVLLVLHEQGGKPEVFLRRWGHVAAQQGYLLVAPEWDRNLRGSYAYTAEEHTAVVDVVRDLRQRLPIDSDRVFLAGWGEGGNMAYDVGLAHPDLFAGVVAIAARPRYFAEKYWRNGQYLPFYVVTGDRDGDNSKDNRGQFRNWVVRGYPSLYVEYKGRGHDWFAAELPFVFDWMSRKTRATAFPELGRSGGGGAAGEEFYSMRASDNQFYWLSADGLSPSNNNEGPKWKPTLVAAALQARITEGNQISVHVRGFKKVTVWLGPGMIDFDKPVRIHLNQQVRGPNTKVQPTLNTLLEDFYRRGDRQRLFWAKVELPVSQ